MSLPSPHRTFDAPPTPISPIQRQRFAQSSAELRGSPNSIRRSSAVSIASSIGGSLDTSNGAKQPANELSQNAIANLLSHPIVRTGLVPQNALQPSSAHRIPTAKDIPPVTLTNVPHIENTVFQPYLGTIGGLYEKYQRLKTANEESGVIARESSDDKKDDYFSRRIRRDSTSSTTSTLLSPTSPALSPQTPKRAGRAFSPDKKRSQARQTPLSSIPSVYFEENFQLENPRIFDIVSEKSEVIPQPPMKVGDDKSAANGAAKAPGAQGRKALHTNAILQEKLSWYMDTVEVHLISAIASASTSFFAALGSLKDLQSEASESIAKIQKLRATLKRLDSDMAVGGLKIVNMRRRQENLRKLGDAADQICKTLERATKCEDCVEQGKLDQAATEIDSLERLIAGEPRQQNNEEEESFERIDLRKLKALSGVQEGLSQLRLRIARGFEGQFIEALLTDLRRHVESVPPQETLRRWANASFRNRSDHSRAKSVAPVYLTNSDQLRKELVKSLEGLSSAEHTARAASAYREAILREIKNLIRKHLPSASDDDAESVTSASTRGGQKLSATEQSRIIARHLRALDAETFENMLIKVYTGVGELLRRLGYQVKVLLDVTSTIDQPKMAQGATPSTGGQAKATSGRQKSSSISQMQAQVTEALDLSSLLGQSVDAVQTRITRVLRVRNEQNPQLPMPQFLRFFVLNRLFADECENVSSRSGDALKDVVNAQVKEFLQKSWDLEKAQIGQTLDAEKWEVRDLGIEEQSILQRILDSSTRTPREWMTYTSLWEDVEGEERVNGSDPKDTERIGNAIIDEQKFYVVESTLAALRAVERFEILIAAIPSLANDASARLTEYLKFFNSKCCQLILGGGALRTAGLKTILTRHLALASQTSSFVIALMPYLRESVRRQAPTSSSTTLLEFDKTKQLFQDLQLSIQEKMIDIMSQRSSVHVNNAKKIDWDSLAQQEGQESTAISPYAESLAKETAVLHRVLAKYLSDMEIMMIMTPIFERYREVWPNTFKEAQARTESGKKRMLRDAEHLATRFSKIDAKGGDLGASLVDIVQSKKIIPAETSADSGTVTSTPATQQKASTAAAAAAAAAEEVSSPTLEGKAKTSVEMLGTAKVEEPEKG